MSFLSFSLCLAAAVRYKPTIVTPPDKQEPIAIGFVYAVERGMLSALSAIMNFPVFRGGVFILFAFVRFMFEDSVLYTYHTRNEINECASILVALQI